MVRFETILCPVDFSPASDHAVDYAYAIAQEYDAEVILLHVVSPIVPSPYDMPLNTGEAIKALTDAARMSLRKLAQSAQRMGVRVERVVRIGDIDLEIQAVAEDHKADFVVMGTHSHGTIEHWLLGSVTEHLLRSGSVPVLAVANPDSEESAQVGIHRILLTTDFSQATADAVAYALALARDWHASITLLHVVDDVNAAIGGPEREPLIESIREELEKQIPTAARKWCKVKTLVEGGVPYRQILETIKTEQADLLVMGIHDGGLLYRALIGSTAELVVRGSTIPVFLIPAEAATKPKRSHDRKVA